MTYKIGFDDFLKLKFSISIHEYSIKDKPNEFVWEWYLPGYEYLGMDFSKQGDVTVIKHSVSCCRCGKANVVTLQRGDDIVYLDDILRGDGWEKDKYGRWFCDECSYKGGDD